MPPGAKEWTEDDAVSEESFIEVTEASLIQSPSSTNLIEKDTREKERDPDNEITVDLVQIMAPE